MACSFEKLKDLEITRDELERIGKALKDEKFRDLLIEYVEELKDPENKKLYEKEITELEKERGIDVTFINPEPGYVIKTSLNGCKKAFVNVCASEHINKPTSNPTIKDGSKGLQWTLPHSISPPREDVDNKNIRCQVYDVVFHPDTLHLAHNSKSFHNIINNTACEAIETNFNVKLDRNNIKFPNMRYKGNPYSTVIRKLSKEKLPMLDPEEQTIMDKIFDSMPKVENKSPQQVTINVDNRNEIYTAPKYLIKHRTHIELEEFTKHKSAKLNCTVPKELVVDIDLPLLKSARDMNLDVTEKTLQLISEKPAKYKLILTLPYNVVQDNGNAKFDKDLKKLTITLPVKRNNIIFGDMYQDSGVESDHGSPTKSSPMENINKNLISELNNYNKTESEFRTNITFLEPAECYILPEHTCHVLENIIAFTLQVKNVDKSSLQKIITSNLIHVKFTTVSSGFYSTHYSFCVQLLKDVLEMDEIEVWDNNVIIQLTCKNDMMISSYFVGLNQESTVEKHIDEPSVVNHILEHFVNNINVNQSHDRDINKVNEVYKTKDIAKIKGKSKTKNFIIESKFENPTTKAIDIIGAFSESSSDELSCSYSPSKCKGILKRFSRSSISRSISESSIDEVLWASSFENCHTSLDSVIPEDGEISTNLKKTVRFNDVVSKQMYRCNSSILGQKKKNQRKARNKKRAQERRHSESELSEIDDRKERVSKISLIEVQGSKQNVTTNKKKNDTNEIFDLDI